MTPTTPTYALPFAIAFGESMVGRDEPCDAAEERRSGFAIQALYLVEIVAEAVRVNALPELRQALQDEREPIPLGLGPVPLGDRLRAQIDSQWFLDFNWFLNFGRARDAFRANLHLLNDSKSPRPFPSWSSTRKPGSALIRRRQPRPV